MIPKGKAVILEVVWAIEKDGRPYNDSLLIGVYTDEDVYTQTLEKLNDDLSARKDIIDHIVVSTEVELNRIRRIH